MPDHRESVVLAGITLILISIPAAPQTVEIDDGEDMEGMIDSKFSDRFEVEFQPGKVVNSLVDSKARLQVNRSFDRNARRLQTAEGYVKIVETNDSIEKTVQTPYGRFEFGVRSGENYSEFTGNEDSREKAEKLREDLLSRLESRMNEVEEKHRVVVQEMLPDISASVNDSPEIEHVNLTNNGEEEVDLSGWKMLSVDGDGTEYMNLTGEIESDETVTYFAGSSEDRVKEFENVVVKDSNVYSDGVLKVYNSAEREILRRDY
jgi:hypothetical protein